MEEFYNEIERVAKLLHKAALDSKHHYETNEVDDYTKGMYIGNAYAFIMAAEMLKEAAMEYNKRTMASG